EVLGLRCQRLYAVSAFCVLGVMIAGIGLSRLVYPFDTGHYEAVMWGPSLLSISGHNPYDAAKVTESPYVMAGYGYLYYVAIGCGLKAFGLQFWFGRGVSLVASCIVIAYVGKITFLLTQKSEAAILAVLTALSSFAFQAWIGLQRSDLPGLAAALAGLYFAFKWSKETSDRITARAVFSTLLVASAFFFKMTIVLPILIAAAIYFQAGKRKVALFTLAGALSVVAGGAVLLNSTSGGGYFWQHFTLMSQNSHTYSRSIGIALDLVKVPATSIALLIVIASLIFAALRQSSKAAPRFQAPLMELCQALKSPRNLVFVHLAVAATIGFVTSSRNGASVNYYLEASMVGAIAVALAWDRIEKETTRKAIHALGVGLLTMASGFQLARITHGEYVRWQSLPYYREMMATLAEYAPPGATCFSVYPELVTGAGCEYDFGDWMQYIDGRSPELTDLLKSAIGTNRYPAMIWHDEQQRTVFPEYRLVPMKQPPPRGVYPVYLYVLDERLAREQRHGIEVEPAVVQELR
ncbi:MAG TPA: hypothetical protein VKJ45_09875, partial [Blastocatellia bacterium]|nr:hypothetical protein [Blastocatellia bacterium]